MVAERVRTAFGDFLDVTCREICVFRFASFIIKSSEINKLLSSPRDAPLKFFFQLTIQPTDDFICGLIEACLRGNQHLNR
jgi:hypothetical protein